MTSCSSLKQVMNTFALIAVGIIASFSYAAEPVYPNRPVRLVVGFTPGGTTDALARLIAPKLDEAMGQPWIVDNRPGAAANLASEFVVRSAPDGYTVLFALDTQLTANPSLYKMTFSVANDLQPVTTLAKFENVVLINPSVPAKTLQEFVALAKKQPDAFSYGSSGVGGTLHLTAEMLKSRAGISMVHIPYKGAVPAIAGLLGGQTQVMVGAIPSTIAYVNDGRLRALATTGTKRNSLTPTVPTVAESGYPGFESIGWFALMVPAGTPRAIVDRIRSEAIKVLDLPDVRAAMTRMSLEPESSTPEALAARIKSETATTADMISKLGIRAE